ncbi:zinc metalloprotease HtpX [Dongia sedimenti]|uniref:Protease HtpX homolog n=1 Tax=Dongia sedimenti TaxID=3064282 RepID=A0ABU0YLA9_9PROT|nr:zinc metalloprotease HtpX [Rhodospirillaceae bacterium R-7]
MGYARTALLLAALTGLFLACGWLIGGQTGMLFAFGLALVMNVGSYWFSDKLVLRMYGAQAVENTELNAIVAELAARGGMPVPKVYLIDSDQPNAFATGRNPENAAVAATSGLMQRLNRDEVRAVLAHELGHVKNRDSLTMTITAVLAGAIGMLAQSLFFFGGLGRDRNSPLGGIGALLVMILAPLAAMLVQMAISRSREYEADKAGAELSGAPRALASALHKISNAAAAIPNPRAEQNPASAHLFIINPLHGTGADNLFSTHPSTENRIARLLEMEGGTNESVSPAPAPQQSARPQSTRRGRSVLPETGTARPQRGPWG